MLPGVGSETTKIVWYGADVVGRIYGVAAMEILVPDAQRRAALNKSADIIKAAVTELGNAYVARILFEHLEQRIAFGKGRGIDRGFDAVISIISETIRTSLPDRGAKNPEYRAIFANGTEEYTSPTIREDAELATTLRKSINDSSLGVKADAVALLDSVIPIVEPAAAALVNGEKQVNTLFQSEMSGRKAVVDTLWEQRKTVEQTLGRGGRGLARFIFFDFRKGSDDAKGEEPPGSPEEPK